MRHIMLAAACAAVLAGCETTTQTTSGADYLSRYQSAPSQSLDGKESVDQQVARIAAVEPQLRFPARIGLARIHQGRLTATPPEELEHWAALAEELGSDVGEFMPVSPLIASMVSSAPAMAGADVGDVVDHIRRGSARQHIDYVLVYEVGGNAHDSANAISVADLTILGMFILPSRNVEVRATANAILLDVRNGYPYGTASTYVEEHALARAVSSHQRRREELASAQTVAVDQLADEVGVMFDQLFRQLALASVDN